MLIINWWGVGTVLYEVERGDQRDRTGLNCIPIYNFELRLELYCSSVSNDQLTCSWSEAGNGQCMYRTPR